MFFNDLSIKHGGEILKRGLLFFEDGGGIEGLV